jgi:hypothetical protein
MWALVPLNQSLTHAKRATARWAAVDDFMTLNV